MRRDTQSPVEPARLRLGAMAPSLPPTDSSRIRLEPARLMPASADTGKVRLGAISPALPPSDSTKVRLGAMAPSLPPGR